MLSPTKSLDGASYVLVQLSNSNIEKEKVSNLMNQIPISVNKVIRSKLLPYDESLTECLGTEEMIDKIKCKLCEKQLLIKNMRKHIGFHILNDSLEYVYGFCGMSGCSIDIIHGSGRGKTACKIISSNCEYKDKFSLKAAEKSSKSSPCTNRPLNCRLCKVVKWSYSMLGHMRKEHSDYPADECAIPQEEENNVKDKI